MLRTLAASAALLVVVSFARPSRADGPPVDTVRLKSGDFYRGVVVERVVGDHVTMRLASGALMRFPWGDLAPTETAAATLISVDSDDPRAVLSERVGTGLATSQSFGMTRLRYGTLWEDVCSAPCNREVDSSQTYRIEGEGIWPSGSFRLSPGANHLHVKAGSRAGVVGGAFLTLMGGGLTLMGGLLVGFSSLPVDPGSPDAQKNRDAKATFLTIGIVQLAVGIVSLAAGIPLLASSTTSVTDDSGRTVGQLRPAWTF